MLCLLSTHNLKEKKNMQLHKALIWCTILSLGCAPAMMVNDSLQNDAQVYSVEGRQGWMVNQKLSFGPYQSEKVKRGWTFSYDIPFLVNFQAAKEKLQFQLKAGEHQADVFCLGKATQQDLPMLGDVFRVSLKDTDVFSGVIVTDDSTQPWHFLVQKNYNKLPAHNFAGTIQHENTHIDIREIQHTGQGTKTWGEPLGYEFLMKNEVVGAVEVLNKGKIILKNTASEEIKLVLASTSAALLVRSNLSETVGK
jgi:hypothetical protein